MCSRQPLHFYPVRQEYLDAIHHLYEEWLIKGSLFPVAAPVLVSPPNRAGDFSRRRSDSGDVGHSAAGEFERRKRGGWKGLCLTVPVLD